MDDLPNTDSSVVHGPWPTPPVESKRMPDEREARRQRLADGQAVLDALHQRYERGRKLTHDEAAVLARNLYEALPRDKEKLAAVDRKFGELCQWDFARAQKERHSLTLAPHQKAVANDGDAGKGRKRLRTDPERYRRLVEAIVASQTPEGGLVKDNVQLLAERVAFGTRLHPVDPGTASRAENLYRRLQDVADVVEQRLGLLRQFRELADYKINRLRDGGSDNWPLGVCDTKNSQGWLQRENAYWGLPNEGDWGSDPPRLEDCGTWFELLNWLPHFPLGFDANFDEDESYWPLPESWWQRIEREHFYNGIYRNGYSDKSDDEVWRKRFEMRLKLFDAIGFDDLVPLRWIDEDDGEQLYMGEYGAVDEVTARLVRYRHDWLHWAGKEEDDDIPNVFWLVLYPSRELDRLLPTLGWRWCSALELEALTPSVIAEQHRRFTMHRVQGRDGSVDIVTESIVERLQRALEIRSLHKTGELDSALCRGLLETGTFLQRQPRMREIERMREQHRLHERLMHEISRGAWPRTK